MSNNFAVYYNNFDEDNNFLRAQSSQVQKYSSNLNQHFDTIPENEINRRFTHNFYPEINPVFSSNINRRDTISDLPFPNDSMINEDTSSNTDKIPQEFKIKKVTKIKPKIKDGVRNNRQNLYNPSNINQKASKDVFSENLAHNKKSPLDDISGNSSDIQTLKPNSQKLRIEYNKNKQNKKSTNMNNDDYIKNNNDINKKFKNSNNNSNHNFPINERLKNQFINRNLDISEKLNRINFLQNLEKECQNRMLLFEKEFKSDIYFKKRDFFNNVFLNNYEIGKNLPLTFIFYYLFDPKKEINQLSIKKNFLESVLNLHGYKNIKMIYDEKILNTVPKYFNDLNYVNTLFQTFEINKLNRFNNEIKNWIKTFELEIVYEDLNNNIINDKIKIYLISPKDIIIEYANSLQSYAEYNFHCDISYDKEKGRFAFKTIANVYNKCQDLSQFEFLGEMWERAKVIIIDEAQKNKIKVDKIFKEYLKKNLYKYKTSINHIAKDIIEDEEKEKLIDKIPNNKRNLNNNNIRNYISKEINKEDVIINNNFNKNKNEPIIETFENKKEIKIINNRDRVKEQILFYGVLLSFFIFIFKTVLSIELGTYSFETFFNILIIIIIGFMLFKTKTSNQA
jgi:hypothetical protein